ncbi:MAG: DUF4382 domain-containing protein, partial [Rhabdochlamydiaceae bacterium]
YATYSDVQVHAERQPNSSGWIDLQSSGEINLMSVIDFGQTIASTNLPSGTYNLIRFNVTSATVTYSGSNYTARIATRTAAGAAESTSTTLTVPIAGGIVISPQATSGAIIDMTPTVVLLGNSTNPQFAFVNEARAYTIPANSFTLDDIKPGHRDNLAGESWWDRIMDSAHYQLASASLTSNSLSITVDNTGNVSIVFRLAAVTATTSARGGDVDRAAITEYFAIQPNQSMVPIIVTSRIQMAWVLASGGYLVQPNTSVTFTYNGPVVTGSLAIQSLVAFSNSGHSHTGGNQTITSLLQDTPEPVISGDKYVITIRGDGILAQTEVVAGPSPVS